MTTIVAIFDRSEQVEDAVGRLAPAKLEVEVLDETNLEQEPGSIDPAGPALVRGAAVAAETGREEPNLIPKRDRHALARAFRARLEEDYGLSADVIDGYVTTFSHGGRFVLARASGKDIDRAMEMLRNAGATRVDKYD